MASECPGKNSWPELEGAHGDAAAAKIETQNPNVDAIILLDGTPVTKGFRCNRVWVHPTVAKGELMGFKGEKVHCPPSDAL
ncbi:inhibitor of trypsin and hageman factor-like [Telopea speciosissima]|uniref:inhibitor of trypsin and hageman factor-like n=1 Tax=Telopea speciosissima TaxID=54955 RepID=UPI001CC431BB|nr:inhibitor of trypsin and hageman factor-like [Telopea speciosissima]